MSYDPKCEELARHFLPDGTSDNTVQRIAQRIQDMVEDEIKGAIDENKSEVRMTDLKDSPAKCPTCWSERGRGWIRKTYPPVGSIARFGHEELCTDPWHDAAALPESRGIPGQRERYWWIEQLSGYIAVKLRDNVPLGSDRTELQNDIRRLINSFFAASAPSGNAGKEKTCSVDSQQD
jgi:hypothetical protein